jgi:hypothetical protein
MTLSVDFDDAQVADFDEWLSSTLSECDDTTGSSLGSCSPICTYHSDASVSLDDLVAPPTAITRSAGKRKSNMDMSSGAKHFKRRTSTRNSNTDFNQFRLIPADDVRRAFAVSFSDVMNLGDPVDFHQFLCEHAVEQVQFTSKGKISPATSSFVVAHGVSSVHAYFDAFFAAIPDCIFELDTTTIEPMDHDETVITSSFTLIGRQVLEMITDHQYTLLTTPANLNMAPSNDRTIAFAINPDSGKVDTTMPPSDRLLLEVKAQDKEISLQGELSFHVNADKKIDSFQWLFFPDHKSSQASKKPKF